MPLERRRVIFQGHVQGVGFRYNTRSTAVNYPIDGFVRNLPDGTVELVAEGQTKDIDRFVEAIVARMDQNIANFSEEVLDANGEFAGFNIR